MAGGVGGIPVGEDGGFGRFASQLPGESMNGVLVAGCVDDVMSGKLRIERFGECRAQLECRQPVGPASQGMAVMIDRGLARPLAEQLPGGVSTCRYAV